MTDILSTTFQLLASSANVHAVDVLIHALDVESEPVKEAAVTALLKRNSTRGHVEVIRRLSSLGAGARSAIEHQPQALNSALNQCLGHGDRELRKNALELVRIGENFDQISTLLEMLTDERNDLDELTVQTLRDLVNRLYEHLNFGKGHKSTGKYLRNAPQIRHKVLTMFDKACSDFSELRYAEDVVESMLALGDAGHFAVKKVLSQSTAECRKLAASLMISSKHPGVMRLVFEFLSKNYPHRAALEAIQKRDDPEFACHLLRVFPPRLTEIQRKNLRQIKAVAWLDPHDLSLEIVPPNLQEKLVAFVMSTGLPEQQKLDVEEWLVRHGGSQGRMAAASVLADLDESEVNEIVFEGLSSEDEDVQAWATSRLRESGIPEAVKLLVEKLDSPLPAVRDTARGELESFNLEFMFNLYRHLDPTICRRAGRLVMKIEPDCLEKLTRELEHPICRNRIRAARAAEAMNLHGEVLPAILAMAKDEDSLVRRTVAEVLATVPGNESADMLSGLLQDPSPRVREAAEESLNRLNQSRRPDSKLQDSARK